MPGTYGELLRDCLVQACAAKPNTEFLAVVALWAGNPVGPAEIIAEGDEAHVPYNHRAAMELLARTRAKSLAVAHNHFVPEGGHPYPTPGDLAALPKIQRLLAAHPVMLADFLIVGEAPPHEIFSFAARGILRDPGSAAALEWVKKGLGQAMQARLKTMAGTYGGR